jgi:hypothetical protein
MCGSHIFMRSAGIRYSARSRSNSLHSTLRSYGANKGEQHQTQRDHRGPVANHSACLLCDGCPLENQWPGLLPLTTRISQSDLQVSGKGTT